MLLIATSLALITAAALVVPNAARALPLAVASAPSDMPLVVIRFNQPRVYFEQPLFTAVSRAVERKPDVQFNLVSFVPTTGDSRRDQVLQSKANQHASQVAQAIINMGVPQSSVSISSELAQGIAHDEVHIFVQ
jgi:hypothetical protein